ncbi:MAG: BspA family leucine-rich repeat surface protein [Paludibacteraceae bacterium]|nr:BspA family leucine-rich repeat surface protein [Paludibacteraceae bacterium]
MKKLFSLLTLILLFAGGMRAAEIYAVADGTTVTFYYDDKKAERGGERYWELSWLEGKGKYVTETKKVVFDKSMNLAFPTSTRAWFCSFQVLEEFVNIEYLRTDKCTDMMEMFADCYALKELDLSHFDTKNVTRMQSMFMNCKALKTIDVSSFDISHVTNIMLMFAFCNELTTIVCAEDWSKHTFEYSSNMFYSSPKLAGGKGTVYDADHIDATYARPDGGPESETPGYFSIPKVNTAYTVFTIEDNTLTYYYDDLIESRGGIADPIANRTQYSQYMEQVVRIVIDPSFANANLTSAYQLFGLDDKHCFVNATSIEGMENLNTDNVTDMAYMFDGLQSLKSLDLSHFNTGKVTTMASMFSGCNRLKALDLSRFNTDKVENMNSMFAYCSSLTELDLRSFDISKVTSMRDMFNSCGSLKYITCDKNWSGTSASSQYMFSHCFLLVGQNGTSYNAYIADASWARPDGGEGNEGYFWSTPHEIYAIVSDEGKTLTLYYDTHREEKGGVSDWGTEANRSSVTTVVFDESFADAFPTGTAGWFSGFGNVETITGMEYLNTSAVTTMNGMFRGCASLKTIDLNSFDVSQVYDLSQLFAGCTALTAVYCYDDWTAIVPEGCVSDGMFTECTNLAGMAQTVYDSNYTDISRARPDEGPESGKPGYFSDREGTIYTVYSKHVLTYYCDRLRSTRAEEGIVDFVDKRTRQFEYMDKVEEIVLDPSMANAHLTSLSGLFYLEDEKHGIYMPYAESIEGIENLHTDEVTDMHYAFYLPGLEKLDLSTFNTANVTDMSQMFAGCVALKELNLGSFNTENVENMSSMFYNCVSLKQLDLHRFNTGKVKDMSAMFLMEIEGSKLEELNLANFQIRDGAKLEEMFAGCRKLKTIYCNYDWSTALYDDIDEDTKYMFIDCNSLVGGNGTAYAEWKVKKAYIARPDGGEGNEGYFTLLPPELFAVTLVAENGTITVAEDVDLDKVEEGTVLHLTATPDEGYEFAGWTNYNPETGLVVTSDTTVTAAFTKIVVLHTVTYLDWNGDELYKEDVIEGEDAKGPAADPARDGYTFTGWSKPLTHITADMTVVAQYEKKESTALDETDVHSPAPRKLLRNGVLYIEHNGRRYDATGRAVQQ